MRKSGKNVGLYLSEEIYGCIARDARARGLPKKAVSVAMFTRSMP